MYPFERNKLSLSSKGKCETIQYIDLNKKRNAEDQDFIDLNAKKKSVDQIPRP